MLKKNHADRVQDYLNQMEDELPEGEEKPIVIGDKKPPATAQSNNISKKDDKIKKKVLTFEQYDDTPKGGVKLPRIAPKNQSI